MSVVLEVYSKAEQELSCIVERAGFLNGGSLSISSTKQLPQPLAFAGYILSYAWSAVIKPSGKSVPKQGNLILLYKPASNDLISADNRTCGAVISYNLTLYYDRKDIWASSSKNAFYRHLKALFDGLQNGGWGLVDFGEIAYNPSDGGSKWAYNRGYKVSKVFF